MKNITVRKYQETDYNIWNKMVEDANNSTFLFHRDFMEYHKDRFVDFSLLVFKEKKLIAIFPAHIHNNKIYSHFGLSYGGFIVKDNLSFSDHLLVVREILKFYRKLNVENLEIKLLPEIYYKNYKLEIHYLLFLLEAKLIRKDTYYALSKEQFSINRNRKRALKVANEHEFELKEDGDFYDFWDNVLTPNLNKRFGAKPVHTVEEILNLKQLFPNNIKLYTLYLYNKIQAGVVLFITDNVAHFQYSSGIDDRSNAALDFLFYTLSVKYLDKKYISYGNSSESNGRKLNLGLMIWKESFGAEMYNQDYYSISTNNYELLGDIFV